MKQEATDLEFSNAFTNLRRAVGKFETVQSNLQTVNEIRRHGVGSDEERAALYELATNLLILNSMISNATVQVLKTMASSETSSEPTHNSNTKPVLTESEHLMRTLKDQFVTLAGSIELTT